MNRTTGFYVLLGLLAAGLLLLLFFRPGGSDTELDLRDGASAGSTTAEESRPEPPPAKGGPPKRGASAAPSEAATPPPDEDRPARIVGRVVDAAGAPVPGAEVYAAGHEDVAVLRLDLTVATVSGPEDGAFSFELPPGVLDLVVWRAGYRPAVVADVVAVAGETKDLGAIALDPGKAISGRVVTEDGDPVAGAEVVAYRDESLAASVLLPGPRGAGAWGGRAATGPSGEFRVAGLGDGDFFLRAEGVGIRMAGDPVVAVAGATNVRIVVKRIRVATGLVLSLDGRKPVAGATVTLTARSPAWSVRLLVPTDEAGRFVVDLSDERFGAEGLRFDVQIAGDAFEDFARNDLTLAQVSPEGALTLELVPAPPQEPGTLRGRVLYDTGEPFANGRLKLSFSREMRAPQIFDTETGPDGSFEVSGITPGEYSLRTASENERVLRDSGKRLLIPPGGTETTEITLPRGGDLVISVVDPRGDPVKDAQVTVYDAEGAALGSWILSGAARIPDVTPGKVTVRAIAPGFAPGEAAATAVKDARTPVRIVLDPR